MLSAIHPPRPLLSIQSAYFQAAGLRVPCAQAHRRGLPVPPVLSGRFRRPLSTIAPSSSAAVWPARSLVPVVGLENKPASQCVTHKFFFWIFAGGASASMPLPGLNRARRFGAGFIVGGVRSDLARRCGPRLLFVVWEFGARAFASLRLRSQCTRTAVTLRVLGAGRYICPQPAPSRPPTPKR